MSAAKKHKTYSVSFRMTGDFTVEVKADSLENAIIKGRKLGVGKAIYEKTLEWFDYDGRVFSVWENT